jgi:hypothetical protein
MLEWAAHIQGTSTLSAKDDVGLGVACDHFGNTYVTGFFNHSAVFGLGEPNETALFGTGAEIFIAKYTPVGTLAWAKVAGGPHSDAGKGIAVDEAGNSYVTGFFIDTSTFASGEINETTVVGSFHDIFVAKYDPQGAFLWVNATSSSGGISQDQGQGIVVDGAGYSYFTGYYLGSTITFGVGTPNATTLQGQNRSIFLARCKPGGGFDWAVTAYGSGVDEGTGVAMDSGGNGYVSGFYENFAIFGQGQTNETMLSGPGDQIFFAKYRLIPSKKALYGGSLQSAPPASAPDSQ